MIPRALTLIAVALASAGCEPARHAAPPPEQDAPTQANVPASGAGTTPAMPAAPTAPAKTGPATVSPCLLQDGKALESKPLRAIGTEPFWGARIEGRCVTYMTPEDQAGTRVWTRFTGTAANGSWTGALGGKRFELRTRAEPGCSDGMSDNVYPIAVDLLVAGEQRKGCAEPAATGR